MVFRRMWMVIISGFFEPVFYLFSIGVGISQLVGDVVGPDGDPITYTAFIAPALLASSAMNGAVFESTMNIFFKLKYDKVYDTMLATPIVPWDIAIGEIAWSLIRGAIYTLGFMVVMAFMGLLSSPWAILVFPAAALIGFAFAAIGMAATTYMRSWQDFDLVTLVTLPLFLFSATFFPLDVYPPAIQTLTQISPLYHSVELIRALTLGIFDIN
ncbi:MAG TPA: ABC transporter, partial [Actinobacteria bacterium]|nr:ABC transporter [Actinomycetota bacterium]